MAYSVTVKQQSAHNEAKHPAKGMRFGHVMHSLGSREIATKLSVTDKAIGHVSRLSHLSAWLVLTYVRSGVIFAMIMTELLPICLRWPVREAEPR